VTIEEMVRAIQAKIPDAEVYIQDLTGRGDHFDAVVVSPQFEGKSRIEQHRLVMGAFSQELKGPLHALALKTYTPEGWSKV